MAKYNMTFEEAQEYISKRGFDFPWNDCDVFIDERYITQTVGNVLKWADNNPKWKPSEGQLECLDYAIEKAEKDWSPLTNNRIYLTLKALKEQLEKL